MLLTTVGDIPQLALHLGHPWAGSVLLPCPRDTTSLPPPGPETCFCSGQSGPWARGHHKAGTVLGMPCHCTLGLAQQLGAPMGWHCSLGDTHRLIALRDAHRL